MSELHIIDVSKWQGDIDWERVKASGIDGAMLRAGYGSGNIDPKFARNAGICNNLGIPIGVYWFSYAWTPTQAENEARYCLGAITPYKITLPIAWDWEYDSYNRAVRNGVTPTKALALAMAKRFLSVVEQAGHIPMLYTNLDYQGQFFPEDELQGYDRWIAAYRPKKPDTHMAMWQYTSTGHVDGIKGSVDCNHLYVDYPAIIKAREQTPDADTGENISVWAKDAAEWAKVNNIVNGDGAGNYNWDQPVTREALVTILHNFAVRFGL